MNWWHSSSVSTLKLCWLCWSSALPGWRCMWSMWCMCFAYMDAHNNIHIWNSSPQAHWFYWYRAEGDGCHAMWPSSLWDSNSSSLISFLWKNACFALSLALKWFKLNKKQTLHCPSFLLVNHATCAELFLSFSNSPGYCMCSSGCSWYSNDVSHDDRQILFFCISLYQSGYLFFPPVNNLTPVLAEHIGKPIYLSHPNVQRSWKLKVGEIEFLGPKLLDYGQRKRTRFSCRERDRAL